MSQPLVLVTGAAGDIGRALCALYLERGARVAGWDRDETRLAAAADDLGEGFAGFAVDLRDPGAVAAAHAATEAAMGPVGVLVNNAGAATSTRLAETTEADWTADLDVNLSSAFRCLQAVRPGMAALGGGAVVNVASVNATHMFGCPGYSAAKAGLVQLTRFAAVEMGPEGIRVNAILPGTVRTRAWDERVAANPAILKALTPYYALRRLCAPRDVAELAWFLTHGPSAMITGAAIPVDGGLSAGIGAVAGVFCNTEF